MPCHNKRDAEHTRAKSCGVRCDEQCIRRLATRLCRLDACDGSNGQGHGLNVHVQLAPNDHGDSIPFDVSDMAQDTHCNSVTDNTCDAIDEKCGCCSSGGRKEQDKCCDNEDEDQSDCCQAGQNEPHACCHVETDVKGDCCDARIGEAASCSSSKDTCADSCCDIKEHASEKGESGDCSSSCCSDEHSETDHIPKAACSSHIQAAFQRYEALLAKGQCLCRSVLEQFGSCCCKPGTKRHFSSKAHAVGQTCAQSASAAHDEHGAHGVPKAKCGGEDSAGDDCCKETPKVLAELLPVANVRGDLDIEKAAGLEHVVLSVSGMTCTGCGKKMLNVLCNTRGIVNPKVTFVSGTAEFDMDPGMADTEATLVQIEKQTGFKCSRITNGYPHLDLFMSETMAKQLESAYPDAVVAVSKQGKKTYRLTYNPRLVGARAFLSPQVKLAPSKGDLGAADGKRRLWSMLWSTVLSAVFTIPVVVLNWSDNPVPQTTRSSVSLALATVVQAVAVPEFYVGALKALIYSRVVEMDMLVVISITAAYVYSVVAFALTERGVKLEQGPFFETSALLITLVLVGRLLAAYARVRAVSAVSTRSLQAESALLVRQDGQTEKLDARLLQFGDTIKVLPHSRIVTDGRVVQGESAVDESMVTGESTPVGKRPGDMAIAGTINGSGTMHIALSRLPGENSITDIAKLVENAMGSKPRIQNLADKIASWFTPVVMVIAIVVFAIWIGVALLVQHRSSGGAVGIAITYTIAVLAITCPCALGLAVPMVLVIAGGVAARLGVIVRSADAIERSFRATHVVFDKTGTLTTGELEVVDELHASDAVGEDELTGLISSLVQGNEHPVSVTIARHLAHRSNTAVELEKIQSIPSAGIQAFWKGREVKAGNPHWLGFEHHTAVMALLSKGVSMFCVTLDGQLVRAFALKGKLRDEAAAVVAELQSRKINCHLVSGDNAAAVSAVAHKLGLDPKHVVSQSSPAQKQEYVQRLQAQGGITLFCGDGTNDAVAVAQADIGVQMGSASDVTGAVADVVLLSGLEGIVKMLDLSKRAFRRIVFNFVWTWVYNTFAILLAAGAFVHFRVPPAYAGLGEIVSVGPVIIVAVTLVWAK